MKYLINVWNRFFVTRRLGAWRCTQDIPDAMVTREDLNREVRRNLAVGMSLRDAVRSAQASTQVKSNAGSGCTLLS